MSHSHDHAHHHHSAVENEDKNSLRYQETKKVTLVGSGVNLLLSAAQLGGGMLTHSQALIADGLHTLSDLASDFVVLFAAKMASQDADEEHPYGHGRIETVATIILGLLLSLVAVGIASDALRRLLKPELLFQPEPLGLFFAALAIISKETLFQYTKRVARKINSQMLHANAWHHRSDAISSLVVLIGIGGAVFLQIEWLDAVAAIIVAVMIVIMGLQMIKESVLELVDTGLAPERVREIHEYIAGLGGVKNVHMLRTRRMGGVALADVHVQVGSRISVSEGHHIAERVTHSLRNEFDELEDITVHIDPEDDESSSPSRKLPPRHKVLEKLQPRLSELEITDAENITLHYLDGEITLSVTTDHELDDNKIKAIKESCLQGGEVHHVEIYQRIA